MRRATGLGQRTSAYLLDRTMAGIVLVVIHGELT